MVAPPKDSLFVSGSAAPRLSLALLGLLALGACHVSNIDLDNRACPCAQGWVCDVPTNSCRRAEGQPSGHVLPPAEAPDGGMPGMDDKTPEPRPPLDTPDDDGRPQEGDAGSGADEDPPPDMDGGEPTDDEPPLDMDAGDPDDDGTPGDMDGGEPSDEDPPPDRDAAEPLDAGDAGTPDTGPELGVLPYASGAATAAVLSDGLHYLGGASNFYANTRYRAHHVYDCAAGQWLMPRAQVPDDQTYGARAHAHGDRLYLLGGYPSGDRLRVFDPATNGWSSAVPAPIEFEWGFASGVIGDRLYAFGGVPGSSTQAQGFAYGFTTGQWSSVATMPLNSGRGALSSAVVGTRLYVLNGNPGSDSTSLQIYDSLTDSWSSGRSLAGHRAEAAAAVAVGARIYFVGGADNHDASDSSRMASVSAEVNVYDTDADTWSSAAPTQVAAMWSAAALCAGRVHVLGGLDSASEALGDHQVWTPAQP